MVRVANSNWNHEGNVNCIGLDSIKSGLFSQILKGVAHFYRHGIAYQNQKSDNILVKKTIIKQ